ncbi:MAG: sulfotransferase [Steroidobacteraceae bacterium]
MAQRMVQDALKLDRQGRVHEAIAAYQAVLRRWPVLADCWYRLAVLERKAGRFGSALDSYQQALDHGIKRPEEVHLNRGVIYSDELQSAAAERELELALALRPTYIPALLNLANLHEDQGRREAALDIYEKALAIAPASPHILARYANARSFDARDDALIARLESALSAEMSMADRAMLGFALGRALDACADYPAAFAAYRAANAASRASRPADAAHYDRAAEVRRIARLMEISPPTSPPSVTPPRGPRPIFICGMFRSGSTLLEQLLSGHPRVTAGGELQFIPYLAQKVLAPFPESIPMTPHHVIEGLALQYIDVLARLFPGAELVTDKRPDNFLYIGLIKQLFPDAKIVHTVRNPLDTCLSIYFTHLDHGLDYALDLMDIGHHYRQYKRLMAHWKARYGADIIDVDYDGLVRAPRQYIEGLLGHLGLEAHEDCLSVPATGRTVKTASVWQVREMLYQRSSGRSVHYERELAELRSYLDGSEP